MHPSSPRRLALPDTDPRFRRHDSRLCKAERSCAPASQSEPQKLEGRLSDLRYAAIPFSAPIF